MRANGNATVRDSHFYTKVLLLLRLLGDTVLLVLVGEPLFESLPLFLLFFYIPSCETLAKALLTHSFDYKTPERFSRLAPAMAPRLIPFPTSRKNSPNSVLHRFPA